MLDLERKKEIVTEAAGFFSRSLAVVVAEYEGLSVSQMQQLRTSGREFDIQFKVIKNTLAKIATKGTVYEEISDQFHGQVFYGFSYESPAALGRILKKCVSENEQLKIRVISIEGDIFSSDQLEAVANLPTFDEAVSRLIGTLNAPITKLAQTLNAVPLKLVQVLIAVKENK